MAQEAGLYTTDQPRSLLFSAALSLVFALPCCDFVAGYLDDVTLGGSVIDLSGEVVMFQTAAAKIGLELNIAKCEIIGLQDISSI